MSLMVIACATNSAGGEAEYDDSDHEPDRTEHQSVSEERPEVHPRDPGDHHVPERRHEVADVVPTPSASIPRCTVTPTAIAVFTVMKPWTVHCPPLDGMKNANTDPATAVMKGNVAGVEIDAAIVAAFSPTLVN